MIDSFPRGRSAIVSGAIFGCGEAPGYTNMELAAHASQKALSQVGLTFADVDGLFIALPDDLLSGLTFSEYVGIQPKVMDNNRVGGSSFLTHAMWAAYALASGQCEVALITYGSNQRSAAGKLISVMKTPYYLAPYKAGIASSYALAAARYMHEFGATKESFGEVAIAARQWAQKNPDAFMREPLTMEQYLGARMVSTPLNVRDCCLVTDGAGAVVMMRAERARDTVKRPAFLLGAAGATSHLDIASMPSLTSTAAVDSGARAFAMAGVKPADIDVVQLYDAFTLNTMLFLEDLGFCKKGEGADFVRGGRIAPGGELPVNTNGGGLSFCHPGMYGLFTMIEAFAQISGTAGERQVADVKLALTHGNGGTLSSQVTAVFGSEEAL
ncbi:acetyl-CoA acetyltransferase [Hydrogenophaga sp. BPS33]|uniref:acetyl-CoA acetyltransferase n=1 Tax=Hydrogenophaga sp. BPS33 TaxID=2651974 RepID=UPI00131FAAB9|nr:acetyl-CoA acetyltransferase [Hydrogenophaga sp. BPS33]QHE83693.1 thiolase [Hydrogenophaga sp. BPS33]